MANFQVPLPIKGINKALQPETQPEGTSPYMNNVRPRSTGDKKLRLSKRPAFDKWSATQINGVTQPIVKLILVTSVA